MKEDVLFHILPKTVDLYKQSSNTLPLYIKVTILIHIYWNNHVDGF